jgi:uracil-DNA glycosylase
MEPLPALEDLNDEIRSHRGCGFEPCETCTNMVPGEGSATAEVMLVGEAPGATEDEQGRPFCGRAGRLLDELLAAAGLEREQVYITNVVKARPPGNRDPRAAEVAHWLPWLEAELALVQPRLVVPLGRHALAHFTDGAKISEVHGRLIVERGRALFPMYHPAAGLRGTGMRAAMFEDARLLRTLLSERDDGAHERPLARGTGDAQRAVGGADPVRQPGQA